MGVEMDPTLLREVINPWLLGADPEFAVLEPPDKLVANAGVYAANTTTPAGSIGHDHGGRVWEVRPSPSPSSYAVVTNIWKLLRDSNLEKVAKFKWKGGALGALHPNDPGTHDTLGGHVHFDIRGFNGLQKKALDNITTGLLNLEVLPLKENTKRLSYGAYGGFGHDSVRTCGAHMEYRCAPSWLDKPGQAFAVLTTYKLAAAKPGTVEWPSGFNVKSAYLEWLAQFAGVDVDAWLLDRFIRKRGFDDIQSDPDSNFRPRWRKEDLWGT